MHCYYIISQCCNEINLEYYYHAEKLDTVVLDSLQMEYVPKGFSADCSCSEFQLISHSLFQDPLFHAHFSIRFSTCVSIFGNCGSLYSQSLLIDSLLHGDNYQQTGTINKMVQIPTAPTFLFCKTYSIHKKMR